MRILTIIITLFCGLWVQASYAGSYRWVDENGKIHYTDNLPAKASSLGHTEITNSGVRMKTTKRSKTAQEIAEARRIAKLAQEKARNEDEAKVRDQRLLNSYTSVLELVSVYEKRLDMQKTNLRQLRAVRAKLATQLKQLKEKRNIARGKDEQKFNIVNGFIRTTAESLRYYDHAIEQALKETIEIRKQYAHDKKRLENLLDEQVKDEMEKQGISSRLILEPA